MIPAARVGRLVANSIAYMLVHVSFIQRVVPSPGAHFRCALSRSPREVCSAKQDQRTRITSCHFKISDALLTFTNLVSALCELIGTDGDRAGCAEPTSKVEHARRFTDQWKNITECHMPICVSLLF